MTDMDAVAASGLASAAILAALVQALIEKSVLFALARASCRRRRPDLTPTPVACLQLRAGPSWRRRSVL